MLLPNTYGLSVFQAALMYADAGIPIAPFSPFAGKKACGNILGDCRFREELGLGPGLWHSHATTHKPTLERWNRTLNGFQGIATSPGRCACVVLDIDTPELFPAQHRQSCKATAHIITRGKRRGHYWFSLPASAPPIGNPAFEFGEIRCMGGGLVLPPYPLDNRKVAKSGQILDLPTGLMELIAASRVVGPRVKLEEFCAKHKGNRYPDKLKGLKGLYNYHLNRLPPHTAMRKTLQTGLGEAALGWVPAQEVMKTLRAKWNRSPREFHSLAVWCATWVESSDLTELEQISRRGKGTDSRQYQHLK